MASLWTRFTRAIGAKDSTVAVTAAVAAAALGGVLVWQSGALEWAMAEVGLRLSRAASRRRKNRRPQYIILVRHGESIGNINPSIYSSVPDHRLSLTANGRSQAIAAGIKLKNMLGDRRVKFFVSPHRRANETLASMLHAFPDREQYRIRVDPRLREQEFGNLQDIYRMRNTIMPMRARFGRFFWRFQGGESGADVYDRVTNFLDTLYRDIDSTRHRPADAVVIVSHGLTMRLFVMRYMRWSVAFFETVSNPKNTEFWVMEKNALGSYDLKTPVRRRKNARRPLPVGRRSWLVGSSFANPRVLDAPAGPPQSVVDDPAPRKPPIARSTRGDSTVSTGSVLAAGIGDPQPEACRRAPDEDDDSEDDSAGIRDHEDSEVVDSDSDNEMDDDDDDDGDGGDDDDNEVGDGDSGTEDDHADD